MRVALIEPDDESVERSFFILDNPSKEFRLRRLLDFLLCPERYQQTSFFSLSEGGSSHFSSSMLFSLPTFSSLKQSLQPCGKVTPELQRSDYLEPLFSIFFFSWDDPSHANRSLEL